MYVEPAEFGCADNTGRGKEVEERSRGRGGGNGENSVSIDASRLEGRQSRRSAELVRRSMDAAISFKSQRPQPQQQTAGLKRKKTPAEKTQARKMRRQRQSEKKKEKKKVEEKERDEEEERWSEMSWAFVEDAAMKKAVAWRERRELLRAWRGVRGCTREIERVKRETKVGGKEEDPTEDPTAASEEPMEHGGWCERLVWSDELEQGEAELDEELDWCEVVATVRMMQTGINSVAKGATVVEENPLFAAMQGSEIVVGPVTASVASVGAAGEVQGDTVAEKEVKIADTGI